MNYSKIKAFARELRKNQTEAEAYFWAKKRNRKFLNCKINRQYIIEHESRSYFIADFFCFEKKLIIELDGNIHKLQVQYDRIREDILKSMGYSIVRFSNEDVLKNWDKVSDRLEKELSPNPSLEREGKKFLQNFRGELTAEND
ncbi:endonuclease domain-containing protein [Ekhidna sp.]|uniref:endonuclease domain-containing protein n=1 Tax=Ekhidna sp. TaxID=2608089 RepID=UPI003B50EDE7